MRLLHRVFKDHWAFKIVVCADDANVGLEFFKFLVAKDRLRLSLQSSGSSACKPTGHDRWHEFEIEFFDVRDSIAKGN